MITAGQPGYPAVRQHSALYDTVYDQEVCERDDADGLDELNLVMIMATDATRTVTATSRTKPRPAIIKASRRELGPGRWPAA